MVCDCDGEDTWMSVTSPLDCDHGCEEYDNFEEDYPESEPSTHLCEEPGCYNKAIECRIIVYGFDVFDWKRFSLSYVWYLIRTEGWRAFWGLLRDGFMDTHDYYCSDHAGDKGYCWSCGEFCSGLESFDFGSPRHLCDKCRDEFEHDFDDIGEEDWWDWENGPY